MSLNSLNRASNIEISSQLTGDVNIDTPQKVNIDALKLKMIKQEKKEYFKNKGDDLEKKWNDNFFNNPGDDRGIIDDAANKPALP